MATLINQKFSWDKADLNPKCKTVMDLLENLVTHFKYLMEDEQSPLAKGRSKPCAKAIAKVEASLQMFTEIVTTVVIPSTEKKTLSNLKIEILKTLEELQTQGKKFLTTAKCFSEDPLELERRENMIKASRPLVREVTKLLILADYVDVANMLELTKEVENEFHITRKCDDIASFEASIKELGAKTGQLYIKTGQREGDLLPEHRLIREELAAARKELRDSGIRLITTSKAYFVNPKMKAAQDNRQAAIKAFQNNLKRIRNAIKGVAPKQTEEQSIQTDVSNINPNLADDLANFDMLCPPSIEFDSQYHAVELQTRLEEIITSSAAIADLPSTCPDRRDRIVESCESLRAALSGLLDEYMAGSRKGNSSNVSDAIDALVEKNRALSGQLHRAAGDQVGDAFLNPLVPFLYIYSAAKTGDAEIVKSNSPSFSAHAQKMIEAARLLAYMSTDKTELKSELLRSAGELEVLINPVINSAIMLSADHNNSEYINNMEIMKSEWETKLKALTDNVDESVDVIDFVAQSQQLILKEIGSCIEAAQSKEATNLDRAAATISGRVERIHDIVKADMRCFEPDYYVDRCNELVGDLKAKDLIEFAYTATTTVEQLHNGQDIDTEELIVASTHIFNGVQDVFKALLETRDPEEYSHLNLNIIQEDADKPMSYLSGLTEGTELSGDLDLKEESAGKEIYQNRPEDQKQEIKQKIEEFQQANKEAEQELEKWDDSQNDLITLARKMTHVMHQMTEYTHGEGQLTSNKDVIRAAAKLSIYGKKLRSLALPIAAECTDKRLSEQLTNHVDKIEPLQHQLKVLARVKQEVDSVAGELVVSGLDSVTSLIQNARNLLMAVLETVRSAHTCSIRMDAAPITWNPKMPSKKPLVLNEITDKQQRRKIVRRETSKAVKSEYNLKAFIEL